MATGILYLNDRDVSTDFALQVTDLAGWPGILGSAPRAVPTIAGPEMNGAIVDPALLVRLESASGTSRSTSGTSPKAATVAGIIQAASVSAALTALDALKATLGEGEVKVATAYATDRYCLAVCEAFDAVAYDPQNLNGWVKVTMTFAVREGTAKYNTPDGYALSTTRVACPIGTAFSRPVVLVHGGGASLTNPTITIRNAGGDAVQTCGFTVSLGANDVLRLDAGRVTLSKVASGTVSDGLAAGYFTSGDLGLLLRPADGWVEASAWPTVELSASGGTPVGLITYTRRYA